MELNLIIQNFSRKAFATSDLKLQIRPFLESDLSKVRLLVNAAFKELGDQGLNFTATYQDEAATQERIKKGRAFVLLLNSEIAGTVLFSVQNYFTNRKTAYVSQLAIAPEHKMAGLGSVLMDWCEHLAQAEGFEGVQLDTAKPVDHLVHWYQRRGYKIVGQTQWTAKNYESWVFEKLV